MTRHFGLAAIGVLAVVVVGCGGGDTAGPSTLPAMGGPTPQQQGTVVPLVAAEPPAPTVTVVSGAIIGLDAYPTMRWLLSASGVFAEIGSRPVTILAPSENAFRDFAAADTYGLMASPAALAPILRRHVLVGVYDADQMVAAGIVTNLAGEQLAVWRNGRVVVVDGVSLTPTSAGTEPLVVSGVAVFGADRLLLLAVGAG